MDHYGPMRHGNGGKFGVRGNLQSASCTFEYRARFPNPTLTAMSSGFSEPLHLSASSLPASTVNSSFAS